MENHVHLVVIPQDVKGLSRALKRIHSDYARALHLRLRRVGHLGQARFHSTPLDGKHSWGALLYVERNPVRAGLGGAVQRLALVERVRSSGLGGRPTARPGSMEVRFDATRWNTILRTVRGPLRRRPDS